MPDVTLVTFEEMEPIYEGISRRARASLGVTAWGMQIMALPPEWEGYPDHSHDATTTEAGQEEVYVPLEGSAVLVADGENFELRPGVMVRVGPDQRRKILPGADGIKFIALGGVPGRAHTPSAWTELGGPLPSPAPQ